MNRKDGRTAHPLYWVWRNMIQRCYDKRYPKYKDYGARGIKVCKRWRGKNGFWTFAADMGERPTPKHTLDRKNNDGNYTSKNCRWATYTEQQHNTRANVLLTANGETLHMIDWARKLGVSQKTLHSRRMLNQSDEQIINTPVRRYSKRGKSK